MHNAILVIISVAAALGVGEVWLRLQTGEQLLFYDDERVLLHRYDARLGWFPLQNTTQTFVGSHPFSVSQNSRGFRDEEHLVGGKPGLLFLGDSFVWGYDVEAGDRFTEKLRTRLPAWSIYNLGVSGYGTDQELLLLSDQIDYYRPRILFLVFCTDNDDIDNSSNNISLGGYYKPYFVTDGEHISLKGIPVPKALTYFATSQPLLSRSYVVRQVVKAFSPALVHVQNPTAALIHHLNILVAGKGGLLTLGLTDPHPELERFLRAEGIPYTILLGAERFTTMGSHWTPSGHTTVSDEVYGFLRMEGLLDPAAGE